MARKIKDLQEQRATAVTAARAILDRAETEKRELTTEDQAAYDKAFDDQKRLKTEIEREERQLEADREMAAQAAKDGKVEPSSEDPTRPKPLDPAVRSEFRSLALRQHRTDADNSRIDALRAQFSEAPEHRAFAKFLAYGMRSLTGEESRALSFGSDPAGGFTSPPEEFMPDLIRKIDDYVFIRQLATKVTVTKAQDLGIPTLENNPADSDWTSELATGTADTAMNFGKRQFQPHPLAKQMLISNKLLRASVLDIEGLVRDRFAYKFGITQEKAFLTGNGAQQPLGLFTASAAGISTGQDVSTGNSTTMIASDGLVEAFYALKAPYRARPTTRWLFSRTAIKQIMKLKDGDGQYLWRMGLQMGQPDSIIGKMVMESEYVPNTFTTGLYVGMIADFSMYWIADALDLTIQRLDELYAATNQTGFIMRVETDAMPVLEEAFVRVKLA